MNRQIILASRPSGLPTNRFIFEGFLPSKKGRQKRLSSFAEETKTIVFYENPHKLLKTLQQLKPHLGPDRKLVILRELTKLHETVYSLTLQSAILFFEQNPPKGEIVVCVEGIKH